ncbi:MAG: 5-formyltetrahydrofolate cyclo-ligase [Ruminococcaceae bacterium]|nr:5-formyltetrahydrofolate cyclo-ligase [Oscillospiraceae bacterium]
MKKLLRSETAKMRRELDPELHSALSVAACKTLSDSSYWKEASKVAMYIPIKGELDLSFLFPLARKQNKLILLPRCDGKNMFFHRVDDLSTLKKGSYGIPEPTICHPIAEDLSNTLVIAPCVAVSKEKARLGWGGGYYDRFFSAHKAKAIVTAVFDFQVSDLSFADSWDLRLDAVFTPTDTF